MHAVRLHGFVLLALLTILNVDSAHAQVPPASAEPRYLTFQLFTAGPGFTTQPDRRAISQPPPVGSLERAAANILDTIGQRGDGGHRLGVVVGPLAMDYTDDELRALVRRAFAIASTYNLAIGLHIDESKFWMNRPELWRDPANTEWVDWHGTPSTGRYLNWGEPWKLAPPPCLNSPAMVNEARRLARQVIGPAIAEQIALLRSVGNEALFAGVIVGWETAIGRDYDTGRALGYCALTNLGFNASVEVSANDSRSKTYGSPGRDLKDGLSALSAPSGPGSELEMVVRDWIETWSLSLAQAGVPRDRIYSHIAVTPKNQIERARASGEGVLPEAATLTSAGAAFGDNHRSGFTTYPNGAILSEIYAALSTAGNPPWASAEGTNVDIYSLPFKPAAQGMESYLAGLFNHGAVLVNVFGWGIGNSENIFRQATESSEAIAAYRTFLAGQPLTEKPMSPFAADSDRSALQNRVRTLPSLIEKYLRGGGDPSQIRPRIARLEENMKNGRLDAIRQDLDLLEATLNRASR